MSKPKIPSLDEARDSITEKLGQMPNSLEIFRDGQILVVKPLSHHSLYLSDTRKLFEEFFKRKDIVVDERSTDDYVVLRNASGSHFVKHDTAACRIEMEWTND